MKTLNEPVLDEILGFCAEDPIERVFLEDVARRGLRRFTGPAEDGRLLAIGEVLGGRFRPRRLVELG